MNCQAKIAATTLGNPSAIKSIRCKAWVSLRCYDSRKNEDEPLRTQGAIGLFSLSFTIAHARLLANDVAKGAAEMNSPVRVASSSRLKKKDR
jgi:hypothetical protein